MRYNHFKSLRARLTAFLVLPVILILLAAGFGGCLYARDRMIEGLREKEMIQRTFGHYVDADFARVLLKKPEVGRLGERRQDVIVLMTDIRGFTPMTKNLSPEKTIEMLNVYFSAMIPLIQQYRGIIVDFVGEISVRKHAKNMVSWVLPLMSRNASRLSPTPVKL